MIISVDAEKSLKNPVPFQDEKNTINKLQIVH